MLDKMSNDSFNVIELKKVTLKDTNYLNKNLYLFESPNIALHALVLS
jgi:hypothetical protein